MTSLDHTYRHLRWRELHAAVKIGVLTIFGVFGDHYPTGDEVPAVFFEMPQNRQVIQVGLFDHHFLTGCVIADPSRGTIGDCLRQLGNDRVYWPVIVIGEVGFAGEQIPCYPE